MRKKLISITTICVMIFSICMPILGTKTVEAVGSNEDIYDIVLFWGQSNMVGWPNYNERMPEGFENKEQFSKDTDIDIDILENTVSTSKVYTDLEPHTAYMYKPLQNSFDEITSDTNILGDGFSMDEYEGTSYETSRAGLTYNKNTGKLEKFTLGISPYISIETSANVNMIPEFCRTYYERTGHKVIAVTGAVGGVGIQSFLPYGDPNHVSHPGCDYMYEAIKESFNGAVGLANSKGYKIDGKYWVCFQGESDINTDKTKYERYFKQVKNNFNRDLGTTLGAIVETFHEIGNGTTFKEAVNMNKTQKKLIEENDDIILGSSFAFDHYVPDEHNYYFSPIYYNNPRYLDDRGMIKAYEYFLEKYKKCTCADYYWYDSGVSNIIHLNSAALSQIGRDCAKNISDTLFRQSVGTNVEAYFEFDTGVLKIYRTGYNAILEKIKFREFVENMFVIDKVKSIVFENEVMLSSVSSNDLFADFINLQFIDNILNLRVDDVEDLSYMFFNCIELEELDLNSWNTTKVKNMYNMFEGCINLKTLDISGWYLRNINYTNDEIFINCPSLEIIYTPIAYPNNSRLLLPGNFYNEDDVNDSRIYTYLGNNLFEVPVCLRKLIDYNIDYNLNGGTVTGNPITYNAVSNFQLKNPTKIGYEFDGWTSIDGETKEKDLIINGREMTGDLHFVANWKETNVKYTVNHWQQNLTGNADIHDNYNYILKDTEELSETTGMNITPERKDYVGFTAPDSQSVIVAADGSTVVNYYYTRNKYNVALTKDEGINSTNGEGTYYYEQVVTIDAEVNEDYIWQNWTGTATLENKQNEIIMPAQDVEFGANSIKKATVEVYYLDKTDNSTIKRMQIIDGYVGKEYDIKPFQIDGYKYVASSENTKGVMTEEPIQIYFTYLKESGVNVKYVDINTNEEIGEAKSYDCVSTEKYDVTNDYQDIDEYTFIKDSGNVTGIMTNEPIDVIYYYAYNSTVSVRYYDIFSKREIAKDDLIIGYEGKEYFTEKKDISGYQFTEIDNYKGTMGRKPIEVNYYYTKKVQIEIQYISFDTQSPILDSKVVNGLEGEEYDFSTKIKEINGYKYSYSDNGLKGKFSSENMVIKIYYKLEDNNIDNSNTGNGGGNINNGSANNDGNVLNNGIINTNKVSGSMIDNSAASGVIPKAGTNIITVLFIIFVLFSSMVFFIKYKKYRNIK